MQKILVLLNEIRSPVDVLSYAIHIARDHHSFLHGIFLKRLESVNYQYPFPNDFPLTEVPGAEAKAREEDSRLLTDYMQLFSNTCEAEGIPYKIETMGAESFSPLIHHSTFADCIVMDARVDLEQYSLQHVLADAHCPVILVTSETKAAEKIILAYDGSLSSMLAIKMYSYLLPAWRQIPTYLVSVNAPGETELKYREDIESWASLHFPHLENHILFGDAAAELVPFVQQHGENAMVVLGAYGRTAISRLLHKSLATGLLQHTTATLFVAHQ